MRSPGQEEEGRQAFQNGTLIFHRNWGYVYNLADKTDGSSKIAGKFEVAPLPGITGPGVSSLGGHNYAIATNAENKGTAVDFLKFMSSPEIQKSNTLATLGDPDAGLAVRRPGHHQEVPVHADRCSSRSRPPILARSPSSTVMSRWPSRTRPIGALQGGTTLLMPPCSSLQSKLQTLIK